MKIGPLLRERVLRSDRSPFEKYKQDPKESCNKSLGSVLLVPQGGPVGRGCIHPGLWLLGLVVP